MVKLDRSSPEYEIDTALARGTILGMETLTDQLKSWPTNAGRPIVLSSPDHPSSRAVRALAGSLSGLDQDQPDEESTDDTKGRRRKRR